MIQKFSCVQSKNEDGHNGLIHFIMFMEDLLKEEALQFFAILSSVIGLAWFFTEYEAVLKGGALDFGVNCGARILVLFSTLFQVHYNLCI